MGELAFFFQRNFEQRRTRRLSRKQYQIRQSSTKSLQLDNPAFPSPLPIGTTVHLWTYNARNLVLMPVADYRIYGIEALPLDGNKPKLDILLLHGASTFADSWRHLGTLQLLSLWGYHAVAIDLPGFGKSTMDNVLPEKRPDFLSELIWSLQMPQPLVVAPSLSNLFVLPHLSMYPEKILAAIIISPIIPSSMKAEDYVIIKASTLVISGDKDQKNNLKPAKALEKIPSCELRIFPHASSPAHQSQPKLFHKELFSFLQKFKHSCR
ncbi:putative protein-lysine deacylase ABHD14B isoform X4 [Tachypleus tridentatus]|uniref:putative protein-lysine deacylase ABHD14B isoform X4 n=1 Tax=Tachypleus tridentatus TaxID=6853 RepID=UPI003FD24F00